MIKKVRGNILQLSECYKDLARVQRQENRIRVEIVKLQQALVVCAETEAQMFDKIIDILEKEAEVRVL